MEGGEEDDHEGPGPITWRRPWQPGTLKSKISRTIRGGKEVTRNVRKGCRTLDEEEVHPIRQIWTSYSPPWELEISQIMRCVYDRLCK
jgi:hypothetical protein